MGLFFKQEREKLELEKERRGEDTCGSKGTAGWVSLRATVVSATERLAAIRC